METKDKFCRDECFHSEKKKNGKHNHERCKRGNPRKIYFGDNIDETQALRKST